MAGDGGTDGTAGRGTGGRAGAGGRTGADAHAGAGAHPGAGGHTSGGGEAPPGSAGGGLVVSGGGLVRVATDELIGQAGALDAVAEALDGARRRLADVDPLVPWSLLIAVDAPLSAGRAEIAMDQAATDLAWAAEGATRLAQLLRLGADAYGATEHAVAGLAQRMAACAANGLGLLVGSFGALVLGASAPFLLGGASGLLIAAMLRPREFHALTGAIGDRLADRRAALSSPLMVSTARLAVMSVDDFGAGVLLLPPSLTALLGDEGLGILGVDTSATVVGGAAAATGLLRETPVSVRAVATAPTTPAAGFAERAGRIPTPPPPSIPADQTVPAIGRPPQGPQLPSPQIRIDRTIESGHPDRFEVYLGGTLDFAAIATDEPWDLTSNVGGIAGTDAAGSYRAVELALVASGATPDSEIVVSGYSQGGLVAAMLAASDDHTVTGLYTLGAPAAQVPVPAEVPWVALEHSDDLVPALGGTWTRVDPVVVRRQAFADGLPEGAVLFPAHALTQYTASAGMLDAAADPRIADVRETIDRAAGGAGVRVESTWYEASREPRP